MTPAQARLGLGARLAHDAHAAAAAAAGDLGAEEAAALARL